MSLQHHVALSPNHLKTMNASEKLQSAIGQFLQYYFYLFYRWTNNLLIYSRSTDPSIHELGGHVILYIAT